MAEIKWIKLATDIFNNRKIKIIEKLPDGDSVIVIWLKLLCLAGDINDSGMIYFTNEIPFTEQMLATQFDRPIATIQLALSTFEKFGMIEIINDVLCVSNWEKYQNIEGMERVRALNRERKRRQREKEKLLQIDVTGLSRDCHAIDKNKNRDKNKNIYISSNEDICTQQADYSAILDLYLSICKSYPKVKTLSDGRKKAIKARLNQYGEDKVKEAFEKAEASSFLKGNNNRNWSADFDWLMNGNNMAKVLDGKYDDKKGGGSSGNSFYGFSG